MSDCRGCGGGTTVARAAQGGHVCTDDEPDAFVRLRTEYGMLLGQDDFRILVGQPRGKLMLHNGWLHGAGVLWGLGLSIDRDGRLMIGPGLAIDAAGRELRLEHAHCLDQDLADWATAWDAKHSSTAGTGPGAGSTPRDAVAYVVLRYASCPDRPVPALADPCDVTRSHDTSSRTVESIEIELVEQWPPTGPVKNPRPPPSEPPYRRLRELLGLTEPKDALVLKALREIRAAEASKRPEVLLSWFRELAIVDSLDRRPWDPDAAADDPLPQVPLAPHAVAVLAGRVSVQVQRFDDCVRTGKPRTDHAGRPTLLPTATIQDLVCGLAPGILGRHELKDAGGPRIDLSPGVDAVKLLERPGYESYAISLTFTRPVAQGSWERGALTVSSLADNGRGWKEEDYDSANVTMEDEGRRLVIELGGARPKGNTLRVSVRGTGPYAVYGTTPRVPFAGRVGGPPGSEHQGHDVAYTLRVPSNGQS